MRERLRDDRGVALIVALLVTFVVLLLSTTVFAMAIRNSEQSANDRKRLQSVSAAEAGLNAAYQHLTAPPGGLAGLATTLTDTVGSGPGGSTFDVAIQYYQEDDGTAPITPPFSITYYPKSALVTSVGASNGQIDRTMETFVVLTPVFSGFEGAIVSNSSLNLTNSFTLNGYLGDDGHIYVLNGDYTAPSGLETIKGNVYVPAGSAMFGTSVHVYGTVWANANVTLQHPVVIVDRDLKASTGSIAVPQGTVGGQGYYCTSVSGDTNIAGGAQQTCTLGTPPNQPFPEIKYDQTAWSTNDPPYTNFQNFTDCTKARDYVQNTGTYLGAGFSNRNVGRTVVYINATCSFEPTNNAQIVLKNDLAIVTRGTINLAQRSTWRGESGTKYLHLMSVYPSSGSPSCPLQDVTVGQFTNFDGHVAAIVYSPCTAHMYNNNTAFQGQVIAKTVDIGNNFHMNFLPVKVPGQKISGFTQDIAYIREVR
ncbi:MAG TPA: hypothetical protein VFZ96_02940 [Actinomycetota bacterium]|nr:hypothetical protein [Actinomycetota bacterium]